LLAASRYIFPDFGVKIPYAKTGDLVQVTFSMQAVGNICGTIVAIPQGAAGCSQVGYSGDISSWPKKDQRGWQPFWCKSIFRVTSSGSIDFKMWFWQDGITGIISPVDYSNAGMQSWYAIAEIIN